MTRKASSKVTSTQVAKRAGVSQMTVSRVMSGSGYATKEVRGKVEKAAREMGYVRNALAGSMHTGKTNVVGVLIPLHSEFHVGIVRGIYEQLFKQGYSMILGWPPEHLPESSDTTELSHINRILEQQVEGLIIRPSHDDAENNYFEEVFNKNKPIVCIDRDLPNANINYVGTDDLWGAGEAARKLLDYNHKSFLLIYGPLQISTAQQRRDGFKKVITKSSGTICHEVTNNDLTDTWLDEAVNLYKEKKPTAVFCYNDIHAVQFTHAINKIGVRVPEDVSVVGYSGLEDLQASQPKKLTTMYTDTQDIGKKAVDLLLKSVENSNEITNRIIIKPTWIEGETISKIA